MYGFFWQLLTNIKEENFSVTIELPDDDISIPLSIENFDNQIAHHLFEFVKEVVFSVEIEAPLSEILLIGGATRMPRIQRDLERGCSNINKTINPEEAVAKGAAIYAAMISGKRTINLQFLRKKTFRFY